MSELSCPKVQRKAPTAVRNVAVNFTDWLDQGEIITGTPTVSVSPSGPTLSAASANAWRRIVDGRTCQPGTVVAFTVSGGTAGVTYVVTITASTSGSQTLVGYVTVVVASS